MNEEKSYMIREAIAAGTSQYGMQTFDQSLFNLFQSGMISLQEALHNASNPDEFRMRVSGILSAEQALSSTLTPNIVSATQQAPKSTRTEAEDMFVKH
jgi:Tfp pilus assembly ATPase PilU